MSDTDKCCCTPVCGTRTNESAKDLATLSVSPKSSSFEGMIRIKAGKYTIGYDGSEARKSDGEGPVRKVMLNSYWLDRTTVSNAQFSEFVLSLIHI